MLVIGAGPAGSAAALRALELGLSVSVLERAAAAPAGCCEWLSPAGVTLCKSLGLTARAVGAQEFSGLELRTWDLRRQVALEDSAMRGWVFDRARLVEALRKRLKQAGVRLLPGVEAVSASANEQGVAVRAADGTEHAARLLLVADGIDSPTARSLGVVPAGGLPGEARVVFAACAAERPRPALTIAVGNEREGRLATIVSGANSVRASLLCSASATDALRRFAALVTRAVAAGILPAAMEAARPACMRSAAGAALEMETHVGKRTILVGDAGGFVCAFSQEGIYPAMRSGVLAAETAARALAAPVLQDELGTFGAVWRSELADYLRLPNADVSLLPMLLGNERIAMRVGRAFMLGEAFG